MDKKKTAQAAAVNRYISKNYQRQNLLIPAGQLDRIKEAAAAAGQSVNAYILTATAARMEKEGFRLVTTVSALKAQQRSAAAPGDAQQPTPEK